MKTPKPAVKLDRTVYGVCAYGDRVTLESAPAAVQANTAIVPSRPVWLACRERTPVADCDFTPEAAITRFVNDRVHTVEALQKRISTLRVLIEGAQKLGKQEGT